MIDESKSMDEGQNLEDLQDEQSIFSFQNLFAMLVLNWQWFLLSMFICLCGALIYLRYAPKSYQVSAKMLIKDDDTRSRRNTANQMLANMQDLGFMSNSAGIENEVEILQSRILARDAVMDLKLYTQYTFLGRIAKLPVYDTQPVSVDIDSLSLSQWDKDLLDSVKSIQLTIERHDGLYTVDGETLSNGKTLGSFSRKFTKLPATIRTKYGVLTFTLHGNKAMEELQENGALKFNFDGVDVELTEEDLLISTAQVEGYVSESDNGITVVLDTNLTPELIEEGFVREIISKIQTMRKDNDYDVMDKITFSLKGNDKIKEIVQKNEDMIKNETLTENVVYDEVLGDEKEWSINGEKVTFGTKR